MRRLLVALDLVIALGLVLAACAYQPPGQDVAVSMVWGSEYGMTGDAPTIVWITPPGLDCHRDIEGQFDGWVDPYAGGCIAGDMDPGNWITQVAIRPDEQQMHQTALAHELLHAALYRSTGNADVNHTSPAWGALLSSATEQLQEHGM